MTSITSAAFRVGDIVEIIAEDMEYEGKIGKVVSIDAETDTLRVNFEGHGSVWFDPHELCRLKDRDDDTCDECGAPTSPQQHNLCEKCRMREADIATAEAAFYEAAALADADVFADSFPHDPELTATAQEIKRLQATIDQQRQEITRANIRAEAAEAARDDYEVRLDAMTEKYKASKILLENIVAPKAREVCTLVQRITRTEDRAASDAELAARLSQGWEKFDCSIVTGDVAIRYVTLTRECPTPQPEQRAPLVTAVPNSQMTIIPSVEAPVVSSRAQQLINASNARIEAAAPLSPVTADFLRFMAAVQS